MDKLLLKHWLYLQDGGELTNVLIELDDSGEKWIDLTILIQAKTERINNLLNNSKCKDTNLNYSNIPLQALKQALSKEANDTYSNIGNYTIDEAEELVALMVARNNTIFDENKKK